MYITSSIFLITNKRLIFNIFIFPGRGYISWLLLVTFCYGYNAWCIVLRATFPYQTPENTPLWMAMDYFCDVVYLIDVALVKPKLMYLHEGFWVNDPVETRRNYKKKLQYKVHFYRVIAVLPQNILTKHIFIFVFKHKLNCILKVI